MEEIPDEIQPNDWIEFVQREWDEPGPGRIETTKNEAGEVIHYLISARDNEYATSRDDMARTFRTISAGIKQAT